MTNSSPRVTLGKIHTFRRSALILAVIATVIVAASYVYFQMFSGFSAWDDEGYLMFGVRYVLRGHRLYNEIYAQYGPFYYLAQWLFYTLVGKPVTHDLVRILAACLWLGAATLLAWCIYRLTRWWLLTGFAYLAILKALALFSEAPGHPEEICLVLVSCVLLICCFTSEGVWPWQAGLWGFLVAALLLTKINIGVYVGLSLLLSLLATNSRYLPRKILFGLTGVVSLLGVFILMHPLWDLNWDRAYCLTMLFSISATLLVVTFDGLQLRMDLQAWAILVTAFATAACSFPLPFLIRGTTFYALAWSTVLQYKNFSRNWYYRLPVGSHTVCFAATSFGVALLWLWSKRASPLHNRISFGFQIVKGVMGFFALSAASIGSNPHFIDARLFRFLTPVLWLILISPEDAKYRDRAFGRLSLCLIAVYLALYAFPVAGAQVAFSLAVMLVVSAVFVYDGCLSLATKCAGIPSLKMLMTPGLRRVGSFCLLLLMAFLYIRRSVLAKREYDSLTPLGLPGAERVRVERADRDTYQWLVDHLNEHCDTFFSMPGIMSLYFWTDENPPSLFMATGWMGLMNSGQQQRVADELSKYERACVVYSPRLVEFWRRGQDLSKSPLARYIKNNFVSVAEHDRYYFMVRKPHSTK